VAQVIKHQRYDPVIFFSFGRRDCETYAGQCAKLAAEGKIPAFLSEEDVVHVEEVPYP
jgi:superfamily II RNA helicase